MFDAVNWLSLSKLPSRTNGEIQGATSLKNQNSKLLTRSRSGGTTLSHPMGEGHSPVGAAYSDDFAPDGTLGLFGPKFYNDVSPAGLGESVFIRV